MNATVRLHPRPVGAAPERVARDWGATLPQMVDALTVLSLLIALATLAFIVDLSFFTHGFRIGGGIAVSLFLVVKAFVQRWTAT